MTDIASAEAIAVATAVTPALYIYPELESWQQPADGEPAPSLRYRWQRHDGQQWCERGAGELIELAGHYPQWPERSVLVLPGEWVVTRTAAVAEAERRYFRKLIPFQLEEDIVGDVDDLHFVYGQLVGDTVSLAYVRHQLLARWLAPFHGRELAISHIVSEAALLPAGQACLYLEGDKLHYRLAALAFGSLCAPLAPAWLAAGQQQLAQSDSLLVLADSQANLQRLLAWLPETLRARASPAVQNKPALSDEQANLACAPYFPRLPLASWLARLKLPLALAAALLAVQLVLSLTEWQIASHQRAQLQSAITERYRQAVPAGAISDPLKQLRNQAKALGGGSGGSSALLVLSQTVPVLTAREGVEVKNLQYLDNARELRLTLQAPALADIEALSASFKERGYRAEVLSVNVNQGVHQARMKVTRS